MARIVADHHQRSNDHQSDITALRCSVCPPDIVNLLQWDGKRAFLQHILFVCFLDVMTVNENSMICDTIESG